MSTTKLRPYLSRHGVKNTFSRKFIQLSKFKAPSSNTTLDQHVPENKFLDITQILAPKAQCHAKCSKLNKSLTDAAKALRPSNSVLNFTQESKYSSVTSVYSSVL